MIHSPSSTPAKKTISSQKSGGGCPFARMAKVLGIQPGSHEAKTAYAASSYHSSSDPHASGSKLRAYVQAKQQQQQSSSTLSASLAAGTVAAHRAIERSEGVKAMMASVKRRKVGSGGGPEVTATDGSSTTTTTVDLQRIDYIRWLIMLACLYSALESPLHLYESAAPPPQLRPLLSRSLLGRIERTVSLTSDIAAHLKSLELESGLSTRDRILEARDEADSTPATILESAFLACGASSSRDPALLHLLTPAQRRATRIYVDRLQRLAQREPSLLVAHAYTRYMGDLSGGQFIQRHVVSRWPLDPEASALKAAATMTTAGFAFYDFAGQPQEIKESLRTAIDQGMDDAVVHEDERVRGGLTDAMVQEANAAFLLNGALFDALIETNTSSGGETDLEANLPPLPTWPRTTKKDSSSVTAAGRPLLTHLLSLLVLLLAVISSSSYPTPSPHANPAREYNPLQLFSSVVDVSNASFGLHGAASSFGALEADAQRAAVIGTLSSSKHIA